jgi:anti-sigma B factor antagonist
MPVLDSGRTPGMREGGEGLRITEERHAGVVLLSLDGELDLRTAPQLRVRLNDVLRRDDGDVVLDLCGVTFIDSTGLAAMLNALRRLTRAQRRLALSCPDGPVLRILRLTRLDGTFRVFDSAGAALAALI